MSDILITPQVIISAPNDANTMDVFIVNISSSTGSENYPFSSVYFTVLVNTNNPAAIQFAQEVESKLDLFSAEISSMTVPFLKMKFPGNYRLEVESFNSRFHLLLVSQLRLK